jgi:hypothetical protein
VWRFGAPRHAIFRRKMAFFCHRRETAVLLGWLNKTEVDLN